MGLEVNEATVVALHVVVGDAVAGGDPLVEVETDKALTDVVAPADGVVAALDVEVGDTVPVGATLVRLSGVPADAPVDTAPAADTAPPANREADRVRAAPVDTAPPTDDEPYRVRAAPVARRAAAHHGLRLESVNGTGPRGRITLRDVERAASAREAPSAAPGRLEPMSATRRTIARRMEASRRIPQFWLERAVDASWLLASKERLSTDSGTSLSVTDLLVQALAATVVRHPDLAASFVPGEDGAPPQLLRRDGVDVGLAVATERGLLVPVVRQAHARSLRELARERERLVAAARGGRIDAADMTGATISLSNLAGFGVDRFNALLNPGESAILAVGRPIDRVVPRDRGLAVVPMTTLTLTVDHRVVDGATGGRALAELAEALEGAMRWRP
jgi:pyruvate dehydrogenase E2 component (dihydrolipoamide acetyltransferase)